MESLMHTGFVALNRLSVVVLASALLGLAGCSGSSIGGSNPAAVALVGNKAPGANLRGSAHGGQQPIVGANVYLFAANTMGHGASSVSLLASGGNATLDTSGGATDGDYYVTTDQNGDFS